MHFSIPTLLICLSQFTFPGANFFAIKQQTPHPQNCLYEPRFFLFNNLKQNYKNAQRQLFNLGNRRPKIGIAELNTPFLEEFAFDSTSYLGAAPGDQDFPAIAFNGAHGFVVWTDWCNQYAQICGARITSGGTVLDTFPIIISTGEGNRLFPSIASDGNNYFVVWMDDRNNDWLFDIYGARVSSSGVVLDPDGIRISYGGDHLYPSIAFGGTNYFIAWSDDRDGDYYYDIYGARVTPAGAVLEPSGIPICTTSYNQFVFRSIAFDGNNYFILWSDGRDEGDESFNIYGSRIRPDGVVIDTNGKPIVREVNSQFLPRLTFDGTNYFAVWMDDREALESYRLFGSRISTSANPLDSTGILLGAMEIAFPDIASDGTNHFITYLWADGVYGMRITREGVVIDTGGFMVNYNYSLSPPVTTFNQNRYFVSYSIYGEMDSDILTTRVAIDGTILDPEGILTSWGLRSSPQTYPQAAFDGSNYLVVWEDFREPEGAIYGTRLTPTGQILDSGAIFISSGGNTTEKPVVGFDGENFLVVWTDFRYGEADIFAARVTRQGVVLDSAGIQVSQNSNIDDFYPAVTFNDPYYLISWMAYDNSTAKYSVYAARVTPEGRVLDNIEIARTELGVGFPRVIKGTEHYFITRMQYDGSYNHIYGARVTRTGELIDPEGIPIDTASGYEKMFPDVAFDGTNYFVVYQRADTNGIFDIYGKRLSENGIVLDPAPRPISLTNDSKTFPRIAYGGKYLVIWEDYRESGVSAIYGARVTTAGVVIDTQGLRLISHEQWRFNPNICRGPQRETETQFLLTFWGYYPPLATDKALGAFYLEPIGYQEKTGATLPWEIAINPNPLKTKGVLHFATPKEDEITANIYSIDGRFLKNLFTRKRVGAGVHSIHFKTNALSNGVYFIEIKSASGTVRKKVVVIE
ncbi:MAG: T9SS type A sorting domain-containing protein [candidate division WOR-3 bacterium]|jgi:hypothetical protein|nr:T9SS type A sorting domain-containing protein [candidate division WOR-3 bacterium]MDH7519406.1 T9SS type A sorting domain-containing protein [bacterium]